MQIETEHLTKRYRRVTALRDCSLAIPGCEVFGLLGPNGAGKTTLLRLLLGHLRPTCGSARVGRWDCVRESLQVRRQVAYLPGEVRLFRRMRGSGVLKFFARVRPEGSWQRARRVADRLQLDLSRRVASMSTGMRQKLALAAVFSCDTPLLILDEPTSNLDPTMRGNVMDMVKEAHNAGRTVLFSSHVLPEVEQVCDRVGILCDGALVHTQVMSELRRRHRIHAHLRGPVPTPPPGEESLSIQTDTAGNMVMETSGDLAALLGWLATLPLAAVRIEPVGLRAVYERYHVHPPQEKDASGA